LGDAAQFHATIHFNASASYPFSGKEITVDEQIIRLVYPAHLIDVPVINQLIRSYELTVNILRAQVTPKEGWVEIQLTGKLAEIEEAITWLVGQGIEVLQLEN